MSEPVKVENEETEQKSGVVLFGVDLMKIECMRGSLLNGYFGAAAGGIAGFMYTSKWKMASHSAFASYWVVATISWFVCRYKKHVRDKEWEKMKSSITQKYELNENEYHIPKELLKKNEEKKIEPGKES